MIDLEDYPIFKEHMFTLKEASKDDGDSENIKYMTMSEYRVIDFDRVKNVYVARCINAPESKEDTISSVDALFQCSGIVQFIEFKNGEIKPHVKHNIKHKISDSLLLFTDITDLQIKNTREMADFILVYNETKNVEGHNLVSRSSSKDEIADYFIKKAGKNYVRFGLEKYQGVYFRKVKTLTENEFNDFLQTLVLD